MKDLLGREIEVGDIVVVEQSVRQVMLALVKKITSNRNIVVVGFQLGVNVYARNYYYNAIKVDYNLMSKEQKEAADEIAFDLGITINK